MHASASYHFVILVGLCEYSKFWIELNSYLGDLQKRKMQRFEPYGSANNSV